jgi:hypothetical protein
VAARGKPVSHCCQRRRHLHPAVPPHSRDTWRVAWRQQRASCTRWLCRRGWRRGEALWRWVCVFVEREAHVGMDTGRSRSAIEDYLPGAQILVLRNTQTEASPHVVRCVLRQGGAGLRLARGLRCAQRPQGLCVGAACCMDLPLQACKPALLFCRAFALVHGLGAVDGALTQWIPYGAVSCFVCEVVCAMVLEHGLRAGLWLRALHGPRCSP